MTADTDREARLEEIRERVEAHERGVKGAAHDDEASDLRFLLAEIDRLKREVEHDRVAHKVVDDLRSQRDSWRDRYAHMATKVDRREAEIDRLKAKLEGEDD